MTLSERQGERQTERARERHLVVHHQRSVLVGTVCGFCFLSGVYSNLWEILVTTASLDAIRSKHPIFEHPRPEVTATVDEVAKFVRLSQCCDNLFAHKHKTPL